MKVSPKETPRVAKTLSQGNISRAKFRNDSARFREPATVHKQDVPILSDSLLRRIDHARHLNNQNSQIQNLPLLPILKSYESRRVLSSSKSGRTNLGSARNLNSARAPQPTPSKTVPKSTKISTFSNNGSMSASRTKESQQPKELQTAQSMPQPHSTLNNYSNISHQLNIKPNTVLGLMSGEKNNQHHESNGIPTKNMMMDDMYQNSVFKFTAEQNVNRGKPTFQSNQQLNSSQSQSSLLASLRNESENPNMAEIIVRPTPINTKKYDEGITKKMNPNIALTPLIKNFRLNSFDFHGEFNVEKHIKNTQILKPLTDFKLKSNKNMSNKNYELAMHGSQTPKPTSKQSINYLAAGILNPKQPHNFNGSSMSSLNRKLELEDFEYYDVQELFKKNNQLKSGLFRKKLSQINEESTIDGTPLSNSRWSSSLSNYSERTVKYEENVDIWSDIDENTNLPAKSRLSQKNANNEVLLTA